MKIAFSLQARLGLVPALMTITGGRYDDGRLMARDLIAALSIRPEEAAQFETPLGNGQSILDTAKVQAWPLLEYDLSKEAARKIVNLIDTYKSWHVTDDDWFVPLQKTLQDAIAQMENAAQAASA